MAAPTLSLTEAQAFAAVRAFLLDVLPAGTPVVRGQINRVPEPAQSDFVVITPLMQQRLTTNQHTYSDGYIANPNNPSIKTMQPSMQVTLQVDVHGPKSGDNTVIITTLFRDDYGVSQFQSQTPYYDVTPLYCEDARQIKYMNGEQQQEERWSVDMLVQCNPIIVVPQQFATQLGIELIDVDVVYPPT